MKATASDFISLFILSLLWGTAYLAIKYAIADLEPMTLATIRILISAVLLYSYMRFLGERLPTDFHSWYILTIVGLGGMAIPFFLIGWAMQSMTSSLAGVIMAITPVFSLIFSHFLLSDHRITTRQVIGMTFGFVGVFVLMGGFDVFQVSTSNFSKLALLLSAIGYAYTAVRLREVSHLSPTTSATGLTIISAAVMLAASFFYQPIWQAEFQLASFSALLYLAVFSTVIGTILMTRLIFTAGPAFMSLNNFLVPAIAVFAGVVVLNESLSEDLIISSVLILLGVWLSAPRRKA